MRRKTYAEPFYNPKLARILQSISRYSLCVSDVNIPEFVQSYTVERRPYVNPHHSFSSLLKKNRKRPQPDTEKTMSTKRRATKTAVANQGAMPEALNATRELRPLSTISSLEIPVSSLFEVHATSSEKIQLKIHSSHYDIFIAVLIGLYKKFVYLTDAQKQICVKEMKQVMALDLDEKNLYTKFGYKKLRVSKANVQNNLMYDSVLHNIPFVKRYLTDYWGINILVAQGQRIQSYSSFSSQRYTLLLERHSSSPCLLVSFSKNGWSLLPPSVILKRYSLQLEILDLHLPKLKLPALQQVAERLSIPIKKEGKKGMVNKKKAELITEIENKFDTNI